MKQHGQTLVELIMAIAVGLVVVTAIVAITTVSLKNSGFAKTNAQATRFSQETLEWIRTERDKSWSTLFSKSGDNIAQYYCLRTLAWPQATGNCTANQYITGTTFIREVALTQRDLDTTQGNETVVAEVTVVWTDAAGNHESRISTQFTDWVAK